jgi:rhodanese-related sulfurtransferase
MREIDQLTFATHRADAPLVIDVREPEEYAAGHVPGARLVPMGSIPARLDELPAEVPVYVICASGNRSLSVADQLAEQGIDAWSVAGGTSAWAEAGRPIVTGTQP